MREEKVELGPREGSKGSNLHRARDGMVDG